MAKSAVVAGKSKAEIEALSKSLAKELTQASEEPKAEGTEPKAAGKAPTDKNAVVRLLKTENPKRGASHARYAHYKDGMTVGEYVEKAGSKGMADIRWDQEHGFIKLDPPKTAKA